MSNYNPGDLLRLSMALKKIRPAGDEPEDLHDLRQAARILEGLSCLSDPATIVGDAVEHAAQVREIISQRKTEAVIERRILDGLWTVAKIAGRGLRLGDRLEEAQARVCQSLLDARLIADSQERLRAYNESEGRLQELRAAIRNFSYPGNGASNETPGAINETLKEAASAWADCDDRDRVGFDRYVAACAVAPAPSRVEAPRRAGMKPA